MYDCNPYTECMNQNSEYKDALYVQIAVIHLPVFRLYCYYTAHARGLCDCCWYPLTCMFIYMYVTTQKWLNGNLAVDLPFQTLAEDSHQIYRLPLPQHPTEMLSSSSKSRIFLYNALALFVERMTQLQSQKNHW